MIMRGRPKKEEDPAFGERVSKFERAAGATRYELGQRLQKATGRGGNRSWEHTLIRLEKGRRPDREDLLVEIPTALGYGNAAEIAKWLDEGGTQPPIDPLPEERGPELTILEGSRGPRGPSRLRGSAQALSFAVELAREAAPLVVLPPSQDVLVETLDSLTKAVLLLAHPPEEQGMALNKIKWFCLREPA